MQIFYAGLNNEYSGICQQMPLIAKFGPILTAFSNPQLKNIV